MPVASLVRSSYRQKCSISYRPITFVGSSRMRAILTGPVCASLYWSFTPMSPTGQIAQWVSRSGVMLLFRSWVRIPWWYYNFFLSFFSFTLFSKSFLSASLYFSKRGAYWDRLCRDVVGETWGAFCQITLTSCSLYYCHLFSLTSIFVIIYIGYVDHYESSISMRQIGRYDFLIYCL